MNLKLVSDLCEVAAKINSEAGRESNASLSEVEIYHLVVKALDQFSECLRYLNTRRSKGAVITLDSEADVQDTLFLMLRPWLHDLVPENPTSRIENRYVIKDFLIPSAKTVVEAKFIRDKAHGKSVSQEIHDDIEMYRQHPHCSRLVFFIYDPEMYIPSQQALVSSVEIERNYAGKSLTCKVVIKP